MCVLNDNISPNFPQNFLIPKLSSFLSAIDMIFLMIEGAFEQAQPGVSYFKNPMYLYIQKRLSCIYTYFLKITNAIPRRLGRIINHLNSNQWLQQTPPPPKDCHFQSPQRTPLGVWESQKSFTKIFPKNAHKPHFYVQLTMFCPVKHKNLLPVWFLSS